MDKHGICMTSQLIPAVTGLRYYSEMSISSNNCCKLGNSNRLATFSRYIAYLTAEMADMQAIIIIIVC